MSNYLRLALTGMFAVWPVLLMSLAVLFLAAALSECGGPAGVTDGSTIVEPVQMEVTE